MKKITEEINRNKELMGLIPEQYTPGQTGTEVDIEGCTSGMMGGISEVCHPEPNVQVGDSFERIGGFGQGGPAEDEYKVTSVHGPCIWSGSMMNVNALTNITNLNNQPNCGTGTAPTTTTPNKFNMRSFKPEAPQRKR